MDTLFRHEILFDTLKSALDGLGLDDEDVQTVVHTLMPLALDDESFMSKFNYTLTPDFYQTRAAPSNAAVVGRVRSAVIPRLTLPVFAFKRNSKRAVNLKACLTSDEVKFFNHYYSEEFTLNYMQAIPHDHAAAAMSRKIEYDFLLKYAWDKYCNPLLLPTNYDFSVIDVGGDWSTVLTRKQFGVHCCNPLLDDRDRARDIRRKARDSTNFHTTAYVCHDTFQRCTKTAPVAISIHSSYDIAPEDIVTTMARRGISNYVGSMFIPENLATLEKFTDTNYGFNVFVDRSLDFFDQMRIRWNNSSSALPATRTPLVMFTFPNGESCEYCHELNNLLKYSVNHTYDVECHGRKEPVRFEYRILKRVGSLIYFEFTQDFESPPANLKLARKVELPPFDGYRVKLEASFLTSVYMQVGTPNFVYIPRGLFDTVANYCLTRITSDDFTIEHAIAYVRSVMSSLQINESVLNLHNNDDSFTLMIACGLAAYQWAHERFKLLESRLPYKTFLDKYVANSSSLANICDKLINTDKIMSDVKSYAGSVASSLGAEYLLNNGAVKTRLDNAIKVINDSISPCISELVDMHLLVAPITLQAATKRERSHSDEPPLKLYTDSLVLPTYADYNQTVLNSVQKRNSNASKYIEAKVLIDEIINKRFAGNDDDGNTLRPSPYEVEIEDVQEINDENDKAHLEHDAAGNSHSITDEVTPLEHEPHKTAMRDFIRLAKETDQQQLEHAEMLVKKTILDDLTVPTFKPLQADSKCAPFVISIVRGTVTSIRTLEATYHRGEDQFDLKLAPYNNLKFCTRLREGNEIKFAIIHLIKTEVYYNSVRLDQICDAIYIPEVQLLLGNMYKALSNRVDRSNECRGAETITKLVNGVAGCGKTHMQVQNYIVELSKGNRPAIFSATNAAAQQAKDRLLAANIDILEGSVSTVDSFLMHPSKWNNRFTHVYIDEALQLHCGKLIAILEILNPLELTGYGDENQITFINFSRLSEPTVDTKFAWRDKELVNTTRRIPDGPRIEWLRNEALYGDRFTTLKPVKDKISVFAQAIGLEKLISVEWLYRQVRFPQSTPLLVLVYRADVANDLRMRLQVTRKIPDEGSAIRLAVATIGESQGEDVPHSLLLRLSSKEETLYTKSDQTIVALTRSSCSWGYIRVPTNFPSLLEKIILSSSSDYKFRDIR